MCGTYNLSLSFPLNKGVWKFLKLLKVLGEKKCFENRWMILKMRVDMCCLCYLDLLTFTPILCLANVFHVFYMSIIYIIFPWLFFSWIRKVNLKKEGCDLGMFLLFSLRNVWNLLHIYDNFQWQLFFLDKKIKS